MQACYVCACVCACVCVSNFNKSESSRFNITAAALFVVSRGRLWREGRKEKKARKKEKKRKENKQTKKQGRKKTKRKKQEKKREDMQCYEPTVIAVDGHFNVYPHTPPLTLSETTTTGVKPGALSPIKL